MKPAEMKANGNAKLTVEQVHAIRDKHARGEGITALAREYGMGTSTIHCLVHRLSWRWLPPSARGKR